MSKTNVETLQRSSSKRDRYIWLDALRGLAALAVVIFHARAILWVGMGKVWQQYGAYPDFNAALGYLTAPFSFGYLGVTLFFVISGFSIHLRPARDLANDRGGASLPLKPFFLRRFLRLYPTYFVVMLLVASIDSYLVVQLPNLVGTEDHHPSTFFAGLLMSQGIFTPYFGTGFVFWTLVIEWHLYLAYPLLFHFSRKHGPEHVLVMTLIVSLISILFMRSFHVAERWPFWHPNGTGELTGPPVFLNYWFSWVTGFYAAELQTGRGRFTWWNNTFVIIGSLLVGLVLTGLKQLDFAELPLAFFFSCALLKCSTSPALNKNIVIRASALVGIMSYSLYCIHVPMLMLTRVFINGGEQSASILPLTIGIFFSLIGASALYWLIEHWSISWSRRVRDPALSDHA